MILAVIDIGTNSVRLYVAAFDHNIKTSIIKELNTTRLGEGIGNSAVLRDEAMQRTVNAVAAFTQKARAMGAQTVYIYATAAVREARNKEAFSSLIFQSTDIRLEILSGEEEALIAYLGAADGTSRCTVIDIGGGSTEVIVSSSGGVKAVSLKLGAVRMQEQFASPDGRLDDILKSRLETELFDKMDGYMQLELNSRNSLTGVSGTATTLACMDKQLALYSGEAIQGHVMSLDRVAALVNQLCSATIRQRMEMTGVPKDRADILAYGGVILHTFMKKFGFQTIRISDRDSLEGFLIWKHMKGSKP